MGVCGYPICTNDVCKIPRYRIAYNEGKIYDQAKLQEFCSEDCMMASAVYAGQLSLESVYHRDVGSMKLPVLHERKKSATPVAVVDNNPTKPVTAEFGSLVGAVKEKESKAADNKVFIPNKNEKSAFNIEGYTPKSETQNKNQKKTSK